jgi:SAM-dependent methyltransferase
MDCANREVFRILKPGGKFVLALPHPFDITAGLKSRWRDITEKPQDYWAPQSDIILKNANEE